MEFAIYASVYLKVHHPDAFTCAMLNNYPLGFYSPATLVKDAQRHGLHFRPVEINKSGYYCALEHEEERINRDKGDIENERNQRKGKNLTVLRLGFKYIKGLRKQFAEAIELERSNGTYQSIDDLIKRVPLINKKEIRALSLAGALNFENTVHRREALWQSELAIQPVGELLDRAFESPGSAAFIKRMTPIQLTESDLRATGLTIGKHPMAYIRETLNKQGILPASKTLNLKRGQMVTAGAVIVRQRPETARGVMFITLEDETGYSNSVVQLEELDKFRSVIMENSFLIITGIAQDKTNIKAIGFESITSFATEIASHDFH